MLNVVSFDGPALSNVSRETTPTSLPLSTTGSRRMRCASIILLASARDVLLGIVTTLVVITSRINIPHLFSCPWLTSLASLAGSHRARAFSLKAATSGQSGHLQFFSLFLPSFVLPCRLTKEHLAVPSGCTMIVAKSATYSQFTVVAVTCHPMSIALPQCRIAPNRPSTQPTLPSLVVLDAAIALGFPH